MQLLKQTENTITLRLTPNETITLNNALNEVLECLDDADFSTRMGATKDEVMKLLDAFSSLRFNPEGPV